MIHSYSYLFVMFFFIVLSCSCFYLSHHVFIHVCLITFLFIFLFKLSCFYDILLLLISSSFWFIDFKLVPPPSTSPCVDVGKGAWSSKFSQVQVFFFSFVCLFFVCGVSLCVFICFGFASICDWFFYYLHMFCILIISSCFFVVCRVTFHTLCYFS